ncbi:MAG: ABC transporter ATP-binding protein [Candidatus Marinimicrobia bacterium]|nr:ABC transporter ATP-binding protein [Candidatus Neomarinimicrobiota bacterium]
MTKSIYTRLASFVFQYWPYLSISMLAAFIYVTLNGASLWLTASLVNNILSDFNDLVKQNNDLLTATNLSTNDHLKIWTNQLIIRKTPIETLKVLCLTIFIVFVLKNIFLYIKNILISFIQYKLITQLREQLYEHYHSMSLSYFNQRRSGVLASIIINDVSYMRRAFGTGFQKLIVEPINILFLLCLLFVISWKLSLIALLVIPLAGTTIFLVGRSIRRKSRRTAVKIAGIMNIIYETFSSIRIVKAFAMEKYEVRRFKRETNKFFNLLLRRARLRHLSTPITETLGVIIGVTILWFGGLEVFNQQGITAEDFIRFVILMFSLLTPIKTLTNVNIDLQVGIASAERVFKVLDTEPIISEVKQAIEKTDFKSDIKFHNVFFRYQEDDDRVLEDISFTIKKGQVLALVGPSGAGKSTIADLIPRFYDVTAGSITLDGRDLRNLSLKSLRNLMGIVTQETFLFNDTIEANIAYGLPDIPIAKIREAATIANALEFIERQSDGFNTIVGEKGVKLSGGQQQRLAIARAVLKNPPILILDEATSSLDTESEHKVQKAIEMLMKDRTVLVIAHRLSTVQNADKIIVVDRGKITESGVHDELIKKDGLYKQLYSAQFGS